MLQHGTKLGTRYEILALLGQGGMGAVYKARDLELDRLVAIKVIRPELAGQPEILSRFKQEIILAREVTHRNVVRIFDLSEADGIKFITMEFIEGQDLKTLLHEKGKLPPEQVIDIIRQTCMALEAAHTAGVVHRDLKPQNIMLDKQGRVAVMDFGIARSLEMGGMTQTGALMGTPEYMSPEQVKGEKVDARSDLFTLGIIFYELLTARAPYQANTALAAMYKRTRERAIPPVELDPDVPRYLSDIVVGCLQIEPGHRTASAREILEAIESRQPPKASTRAAQPAGETAGIAPKARLYRRLAIAGAIVVVLAVSVFALRGRIFTSGGSTPVGTQISLAILPFRNASADPSLDWLGTGLAEMLRTDVGQSASLRTVSQDRLQQLLRDLRISAATELDPTTVRRIAEFTNAEMLLTGRFARMGEQIRIDATLQDLKHQKAISFKAEAAGEKDLLKAVEQLARDIRENLTLSSGEVGKLEASVFRPSTSSVEALKAYNEGLQLSRQGNYMEARKQFEAAIQSDPNFALAYVSLAESYSNLGYGSEAEQYARKVTSLIGSLPARERFLVEAKQASLLNDVDKAIESFENLAKAGGADEQVNYDLASLYEAKGDYGKAREQYARVLAADPKNLTALLAAGRVEIQSGNPEGSLDSLNRALSLSVQLDNKEARASILQAIGIAYKLLRKPEEALRNYQDSFAIKKEIGDKRGMAASLSEIAQVQEIMGKPDAARAGYEEALKVQREINDKRGQGITLMNLGDLLQSQGKYDESLRLTREALQVQKELGNEGYQASCLNNIANIYVRKAQFSDALTYYQWALQLWEKTKSQQEIAMTVHNLAETFSKMGQSDQAMKNYLRALELWRSAGDARGVALASYGMGALFELQGRYGAGLESIEEARKGLQNIQDKTAAMAEVEGGYGNALTLVGRFEEAQKSLGAALQLARELDNKPVAAQILNYQGDVLFYQGDVKQARAVFEKAAETAKSPPDQRLILLSRLNLAKAAVKEGQAAGVVGTLRGLKKEMDQLGMKTLAAEASVYLSEALLKSRSYAEARAAAEDALRRAESGGMKPLTARSHHLLARVLEVGGKRDEAIKQLQQAAKVVEEMHRESRSDALLARADLREIVSDEKKAASASKR